MSKVEKETIETATVHFRTANDRTSAIHFMKQVDLVAEMCRKIEPNEDFKGKAFEEETAYISDLPRIMLRTAYDAVLKELHHRPKRFVFKTAFRGKNYEIYIIVDSE